MTYYRRHIFVCENRREGGEKCCGEGAAAAVAGGDPVKTLRRALKEQGEHGKGRARVNRAGCFDRCAEGPVLVVYPDNVWYRYKTEEDLQQIAAEHIINGTPVRWLEI